MRALLLCPCLLCCGVWAEASGPGEHIVSIEQEPSHRPVFKGASLRVFDAYFPAGKVSLYHSHTADSVFVCLEGADVASEEPGKPITPRPPISSGQIYYRPYAQAPIVHRVKNLSSTSFRILDIEVLKPLSSSRASLSRLPDGFSIEIDNDRVRVSKIKLDPGQSTGQLEYRGPRLLTTFANGRLEIAPQSTAKKKIDAVAGGLIAQEAASVETITNIGDTPLDLVSLEVK